MAVKPSRTLSTIHPKMARHMAVETSCFICAKQYQASHGVNANVCPGQQRREVRNKIGLKANICHHHYLSQLRNIFSIIPNSSRFFRDQCQLHGVYGVSLYWLLDQFLQIYPLKIDSPATQARIFSASLVGTKSPQGFRRISLRSRATGDATTQTCPCFGHMKSSPEAGPALKVPTAQKSEVT